MWLSRLVDTWPSKLGSSARDWTLAGTPVRRFGLEFHDAATHCHSDVFRDETMT